VSKLASEVLKPYELFGGVKTRCSASLGVSIFPDDAGDAATLMAHADKAMYAAKRAGKNAFCIYSAGNSGNPTVIPSSSHQAA
jgi:GGDEF domain-containing protein